MACKGAEAGKRRLGTSLCLPEKQVGQGGNALLMQQVPAAEHAGGASQPNPVWPHLQP